jgi:hypothetical protein
MKILTLLLLIATYTIQGQDLEKAKPEQLFDFWIGEWDLKWEDPDGSFGEGKNTITRIMKDNVIQENFEGLKGVNKGFIGMSVSVYNPVQKMWYQTWVDNQGAYLDFWGEFDGEKRMFVRKYTGPKGQEIMQRMVFHDISKNAFTWDWENSLDDGKTWNLNWQIKYKRSD